MQVLPSGPLRQVCTLMLRQYLNRNDGDTFQLKYCSFSWFDPLLIQVLLIFLSQNGSYLFSLKYRSFRTIRTGWRILLDSEFLWTYFDGDNKWCQRRGCGVQQTLYRVRSGGARAKPLLDSVNTVQSQGQVRVRFGLSLGQIQVRFGLGLENRYEPF